MALCCLYGKPGIASENENAWNFRNSTPLLAIAPIINGSCCYYIETTLLINLF